MNGRGGKRRLPRVSAAPPGPDSPALPRRLALLALLAALAAAARGASAQRGLPDFADLAESVLPAVIGRAQHLLEEHCRTFGGDAA